MFEPTSTEPQPGSRRPDDAPSSPKPNPGSGPYPNPDALAQDVRAGASPADPAQSPHLGIGVGTSALKTWFPPRSSPYELVSNEKCLNAVARESESEAETGSQAGVNAFAGLASKLVSHPTRLQGTVEWDRERLFVLTFSNVGKGPTGPFKITLPRLPGIRLTSSSQVADLLPGASVTIDIAALVPQDTPLGPSLAGSIVAVGPKVSLLVPMALTVVAKAEETLRFVLLQQPPGGGKPIPLSDARIMLRAEMSASASGETASVRDAVSDKLDENEYAGLTNPLGMTVLRAVPPGAYQLEIAPRHGRSKKTKFLVKPDHQGEVRIIMPASEPAPAPSATAGAGAGAGGAVPATPAWDDVLDVVAAEFAAPPQEAVTDPLAPAIWDNEHFLVVRALDHPVEASDHAGADEGARPAEPLPLRNRTPSATASGLRAEFAANFDAIGLHLRGDGQSNANPLIWVKPVVVDMGPTASASAPRTDLIPHVWEQVQEEEWEEFPFSLPFQPRESALGMLRPDFLMGPDGLPESITPVKQASLGVLPNPDPSRLHIRLRSEAVVGWAYYKIADPSKGALVLAEVRRPDASVVPMGSQVWTTRETVGPRSGQMLIHMLDRNGPGMYVLIFAPHEFVTRPGAPSPLPPLSVPSPVAAVSPPIVTPTIPEMPVHAGVTPEPTMLSAAFKDVQRPASIVAPQPDLTREPAPAVIPEPVLAPTVAAADVVGLPEIAPPVRKPGLLLSGAQVKMPVMVPAQSRESSVGEMPPLHHPPVSEPSPAPPASVVASASVAKSRENPAPGWDWARGGAGAGADREAVEAPATPMGMSTSRWHSVEEDLEPGYGGTGIGVGAGLGASSVLAYADTRAWVRMDARRSRYLAQAQPGRRVARGRGRRLGLGPGPD